MTTISVVIPAYNVEGYVAHAIRSALEQSEPPDEIVVVDDGSTDGTAAIASSFESVKVVGQPNAGLAAARNAGGDVATGDLIFFLDADDALLPGALAVGRRELARHRGAEVLIPNFELWRDDRYLGLGWPPKQPRVLDKSSLSSIVRRNWLISEALMTRDAWSGLRYRGDLRRVEDLDFWLRALLAGMKIVVSPFVGLRVRVGRPGSLTSGLAEMRSSRRKVYEDLLARSDLGLATRLVAEYKLVRSSVGEVAAHAATDRSDAEGGVESLKRSPNRSARVLGRVLGLHPAIVRLIGRLASSRRFGADHPGAR